MIKWDRVNDPMNDPILFSDFVPTIFSVFPLTKMVSKSDELM